MNKQIAEAVSRSRRIVSACSCFLLLLLTLSSVALAQSGTWARQRSGTMAWLHAVFFLDQNRGWVVGSKGIVLQKRDGGKTWTAPRGATQEALAGSFFLDDQNGWLGCEGHSYQLKNK